MPASRSSPDQFKATQFQFSSHIYVGTLRQRYSKHLLCSLTQKVFNNRFSVCVCVCVCFAGTVRTLHEVSLQESIRYAPGDAVEKWLNDLLCLDCLNITRIVSGCPLPEACELYPPWLRVPHRGSRGGGWESYGEGLALCF